MHLKNATHFSQDIDPLRRVDEGDNLRLLDDASRLLGSLAPNFFFLPQKKKENVGILKLIRREKIKVVGPPRCLFFSGRV